MALEDELAKLTRRRGGVGRPPGQNRGVAFGVAAIGDRPARDHPRAGRALEPRAHRAERGRRRLQRRPARQEDPAPADPARVRADLDGLAVAGSAPVSVGGLAAALHHHEHARARRPRRRRRPARPDRRRHRRRPRGEDLVHHRLHRPGGRQAREGVRRALRQPHLSRAGPDRAPAPVGGRRGLRRVPRHGVPARARQRPARDARALPLRRARLLVRAALQQGRRARPEVRGRDEREPRRGPEGDRRGAQRRPLDATSAASTSRTSRSSCPRSACPTGCRRRSTRRRRSSPRSTRRTPTSRRRASASRSTTRSGARTRTAPPARRSTR